MSPNIQLLDHANMRPVTKKTEIPTMPHLAILVFKTSNIYHEGDERSRTCPGHGYPAYTETIYTVDYIPFADEKGVNDWIVARELNKKPEWVLPEPPAGKKWQRQDFTEADLPPGYRPFLDGEKREADDEMLSFGSPQAWTKYSVMQKNKEYPDGHAYSSSNKTRTKRPLPPQFKHLDPKDIIPGSVLRRDDWKPDEWEMITAVYWNRVKVAGSDTSYSYGEIMEPTWSIKYPNSTVWERCHKATA